MAHDAGPPRESSTAYASGTLRIRIVRCRAPAEGCGAIEYSGSHRLVFPQCGVFIKHEGPHTSRVADRSQAVFFTANRPYRVSHPVAGGDDCLVLEPAPALLLQLLEAVDPAAAGHRESPFAAPTVLLPPAVIAARRVLWHRIRRGLADALEIEDRAYALLASTLGIARRQPGPPAPLTSRSAELARAVQVTIAAKPSNRWSLETLAGQLQCSPFHVAHTFRAVVGLPVHQYVLRVRLATALDAVLDRAASLSRIALDAGFAHHSHFTAAFRRLFGLSPSALRRGVDAGTRTTIRKIVSTVRTT